MASVYQLEHQLADFEEQLRTRILTGEAEIDAAVVTAIRLGYTAAKIAAEQKMLELGIKGILPDGRVGKIIAEVGGAIEASKARAVA